MKNSPLRRPEVIRQYLMNLIFANREEEAMIPSEWELCRQFQVTRPTVRLAIKSLVREGTLEIRPGLGTFIIRQNYNTDEYRRPYPVITIIIGDGRLVAMDPFFGRIQAAASLELLRGKAKIRPGMLQSGDKETILEELKRLKTDGVVWICPNDLDYPRALERMGVPVVCVNRGMDDPELHSVYYDMEKAGLDSGNWLLDRERRNILYVRRPDRFSDNRFFCGLTAAFAGRGVSFSDHLIVNEERHWQERLKLLLQCRTPIDAVYSDSQLTSDILAEMYDCGVAPGRDLLLFSTRHRMELSPEVPSVTLDMPLEALGKNAARHLLDRLAGEASGRICECLPIPLSHHPNTGV